MPIDYINAVGYEPRTNPAVLTANDTQTIGGVQDYDLDIEIDDTIQLLFLGASINFDNIVAAADGKPKIQLLRNNVVIDELIYEASFTDINTAAGTKLLYAFGQQRPDLVKRGDKFTLRLRPVDASVGTVEASFVLNVIGMYV